MLDGGGEIILRQPVLGVCAPASGEAVMSYEDVLGLLIGIGALAAVLGYLADVYFHPQRFQRLESSQSGAEANAPFAKAPQQSCRAA